MTRTQVEALAVAPERPPAAEAAPDVAEVTLLDRAGLIRLWREIFADPPPRSISQPLLRRILAFEIQLRASGGWPPGLLARLDRVSREGARPKAAIPGAGGRLLREWNGTTHVVEITADGYLWNGQPWRSLSAIAREITGAQWSGPRFFGLDRAGQGAGQKGHRA